MSMHEQRGYGRPTGLTHTLFGGKWFENDLVIEATRALEEENDEEEELHFRARNAAPKETSADVRECMEAIRKKRTTRNLNEWTNRDTLALPNMRCHDVRRLTLVGARFVASFVRWKPFLPKHKRVQITKAKNYRDKRV